MNWKLNYKGKALIISSGTVFIRDKKPKGLYLDDALEMIKAKPEDSYYYKTISRRITLGEAVEFEGLEKLGEHRDTYSSSELIILDPEREFKKLPTTGEELLSQIYKSKPINIKEE